MLRGPQNSHTGVGRVSIGSGVHIRIQQDASRGGRDWTGPRDQSPARQGVLQNVSDGPVPDYYTAAVGVGGGGTKSPIDKPDRRTRQQLAGPSLHTKSRGFPPTKNPLIAPKCGTEIIFPASINKKTWSWCYAPSVQTADIAEILVGEHD